jgi:ParB family chromosome partitioning protein
MIVLGGYTNAEIAAKIDLTPDYIAAICYLLEHGEECLLVAVERGVMPANVAMEIARASDGDIQQALAEAYENKLLPGNHSVDHSAGHIRRYNTRYAIIRRISL